MKDLAFSVNDVFLKIEGNIFSNAEILHRIGHAYSELAANPEEIVNAGLACEDYRSKIEDVDFLLTEVLCRYPLDLNKRPEINLEVVFLCQVVIWRFRIVGFWLRN
jgi:hypothetical protein